jgi:hypothetical protein
MGGGDAAPDPTAHVGEERGGISAGDCRLLVALRPIASRPVVELLIGDADAIALARVPV